MRIEEKEYTKSIDISIWKKVFPFLAPRKNVLIMVIVMNILCSVVDIIMPYFSDRPLIPLSRKILWQDLEDLLRCILQ